MTTKKKTQHPRKVCQQCEKEYSIMNFYQTNSPFSSDGKVDVCKKCVKNIVDEDDIETIYNVLQIMDLVFISDVWENAYESKGETFGNYIRQINSLTQYKNMRYKDSSFSEKSKPKKKKGKIAEEISKIPLRDLTDKWGDYPEEELRAFEKKYVQLINNYSEKTAMHREALLTYIRYRVKEEIATAKGDIKDAKEWGGMASKAATDAKINPSQLSKADLTDGLSTFSELSMAVEKEVDVIRILPRFKARPNDALDFNIWCYVNYIRDLKGLEPCTYEEVYQFYDKNIKDYIEQYGDPYGIFEEDNSLENRDKIEKFIVREKDNKDLGDE